MRLVGPKSVHTLYYLAFLLQSGYTEVRGRHVQAEQGVSVATLFGLRRGRSSYRRTRSYTAAGQCAAYHWKRFTKSQVIFLLNTSL